MSTVRMVIVLLLASIGCGENAEPEPYDSDFAIPRSERFAESLSAYGLFQEPMSSLQPSDSAILYELSSELFTDYANKQRLLVIPGGTAIALVDDNRLEFPEGTALVKTFYYPLDMRDANGPARVIETRLLVKTAGLWNVATYLWNAEQTDATLLLEGTTTEVSWVDETGVSRTTDYVVPREGECVTCHQSGGSSALIGPTPRNLNRNVVRGGDEVNQLEHFRTEGLLEDEDWASTSSIPDYRDTGLPLERRARAYLDINCAHCHSPGRWDQASEVNLDFRFETPLGETGLVRNAQDLTRVLESGDMPFLGTTIRHDEGVRLVLDYVDGL